MDDRENDHNLAPEIEGKLRQFKRILMSYIDFQQADEIAQHIIEHNLHERYPHDRFLLQGLNTGMIVAYCRPFSQNERGGGLRVPNLPDRIFRVLNDGERQLHEVVKKDRDSVLAHSDWAAWQLRPQVIRVDGREFLVPLHHDVHAPLTYEATIQFADMCEKLREACFKERERLAPQLKSYFEVLEYEDEGLYRE